MAIENARAPALPIAPRDYNPEYMAQLLSALRLYFNQLDGFNANKAYSYRADKFILNLDGGEVADEGQITWNPVDETANLGLAYGVTNQIGQETYARVANTTGVTIPNGSVVGYVGATANAILVAPFLADGVQPSLYAFGVMTHDLPDSGDKGYCTVWGFVRDLNTSAFAAGDILYASPTVAGALTKVKPTAPNNVVPIAICVVSHATAGVIFVRPIPQQMQYYGAFSATTSQTAALIDTPYAVTFNITDISNGVVIGTPTSRLVVPQSGLYVLDINLQVSSSSASAKNMWYWFRKNGVDLANSAHIVTSNINGGYTYAAHTFTVSLAANDYVELMFAVDNTSMSLATVPATAFAPAAPAVQMSVTQVQQ